MKYASACSILVKKKKKRGREKSPSLLLIEHDDFSNVCT